MESNLSRHAEMRMAQRSIAPQVVDWLLDYGTVRRSRDGDVYSFDKKSRRALQKHLGDSFYRRIRPLLDCYIVVADDGAIITAAHRLRRAIRH